jgi:hypothetical protein
LYQTPKTKGESCNSLSFKALQFSAQADRGQDSQGGTSKTMGVPSKDSRDTQQGSVQEKLLKEDEKR